jgi:hypothetical protein
MRLEKKPPKEKFYVFSGIEKTLISQNFIDSYYRGCPAFHGTMAPDPRCIRSLNDLISSLSEKYDVKLVITSKKRSDPDSCLHYLKMYGLNPDTPVFFTKYIDGPRGEKVIDFLESQGASPLEFHTAPLYVRFLKNFKDNPDFKNYIVIEGGNKKLSRYIPSSQIKRVSQKTGLTQNDVDEILIANGIEPSILPNNQKL